MTSTLAECSSHIRHNMTIYFYLYLYQLILCLVCKHWLFWLLHLDHICAIDNTKCGAKADVTVVKVQSWEILIIHKMESGQMASPPSLEIFGDWQAHFYACLGVISRDD